MITLNEVFMIDVVEANLIQRVAILRAASVTHSFSSDQRYVGLEFSAPSGTQLRVTGPPITTSRRRGPTCYS